ncbi:MAG: hypothetical protein IJ725_03610 [Ruminococcus sp.]|nr:hypothetical protein [Ruminococcus sp.]
MMDKLETIIVYIYGFGKFCAYWYVRLFWPLAFATAMFLLITGENAVKQGYNQFTFAHALIILAIIVTYILLTELWGIFFLLEKLENRRPPRHYRKEI